MYSCYVLLLFYLVCSSFHAQVFPENPGGGNENLPLTEPFITGDSTGGIQVRIQLLRFHLLLKKYFTNGTFNLQCGAVQIRYSLCLKKVGHQIFFALKKYGLSFFPEL